jgi:hypothetical protein
LLNKNIDRIEASQDHRNFLNLLSVGSTEAVKSRQQALSKTIGDIVVYEKAPTVLRIEEELDREGLDWLRGKGRL